MKTEEQYHIYDVIIANTYNRIGELISKEKRDFIYDDTVYSKLFLRVALMYLNTCKEDVKITLRVKDLSSVFKMKWKYRKNKSIKIKKENLFKPHYYCTNEMVDICNQSAQVSDICKDIWEEYYS